MRVSVVALVVVTGVMAAVVASVVATRAARADVNADVAAVGAAAPGQARLDAAKVVIDAGARSAPELVKLLHAKRAASADQVRALLKSLRAEVPNAKGTFETPGRSDKPAPELDWLGALAKVPAASPGLADALEVVTVLRALAAAHSEPAADALLAFGFSADGLVYRDECGRQLRAMSPASLPTLLRASQEKSKEGGSLARYAAYQLDRMSMNRPSYALAAATDDALEVAMLHAIRDVKHPDAVTAVLDRLNAPSHAVRAAAREAWTAYVTGPEPPPAPKEYRKLPGGKRSPEPLPLYLTYRELADQELRRVLTQLTGSEPQKKLTPAEMTQVLLGLYDRQRSEQGEAVVRDALPLTRDGKWDEVEARYDALLSDNPLFDKRASLAPGYLEIGRYRARKGAWPQAMLAFDKAVTLDPDGEAGKAAQAELDAARATPHPDGAPAPAAASGSSPRPPAAAARRPWLLYAGLGSGVLGAALVLLGARGRRRAA
jgi:hypothetical protein